MSSNAVSSASTFSDPSFFVSGRGHSDGHSGYSSRFTPCIYRYSSHFCCSRVASQSGVLKSAGSGDIVRPFFRADGRTFSLKRSWSCRRFLPSPILLSRNRWSFYNWCRAYLGPSNRHYWRNQSSRVHSIRCSRFSGNSCVRRYTQVK